MHVLVHSSIKGKRQRYKENIFLDSIFVSNKIEFVHLYPTKVIHSIQEVGSPFWEIIDDAICIGEFLIVENALQLY